MAEQRRPLHHKIKHKGARRPTKKKRRGKRHPTSVNASKERCSLHISVDAVLRPSVALWDDLGELPEEPSELDGGWVIAIVVTSNDEVQTTFGRINEIDVPRDDLDRYNKRPHDATHAPKLTNGTTRRPIRSQMYADKTQEMS